jgi:AhpC/TSA family
MARAKRKLRAKRKPAAKRRSARSSGKSAPARRWHMLKVGETASYFSAIADDGKTISLSDFPGKRVLLYFYPKANTSG